MICKKQNAKYQNVRYEMKRTLILTISTLLVFTVAIGISSCSENSISNPVDPAASIGIPADEIQWVQAKPEVVKKFAALERKVWDGAMITAAEGGTVGGWYTWNNSANFPAGAVSEDTYVTVEVKYMWKWGVLYVELLPSGTFNVPVEVTMSWDCLHVNWMNVQNLKIYYSQNGKEWFEIEGDISINYMNRTCTFETLHFTRFGWGF
jgi:hypothetical protein